MPITNRNTKVLHKREPQLLSAMPSANAGESFASDPTGLADDMLFVTGVSTANLYSFTADSYIPVASPSFTSFGSGSDQVRSAWSNTFTATGGSTTTITLSATQFRSNLVGSTVEFLTGLNAGVRTTISNVIVDNAATTVVVPTLANAVANTDTFRMNTGRYFVWAAASAGTNGFKSFDVATQTWSAALSTTNIPASWATDCRLVQPFIWGDTYASGTATSGTASTLVNSAKSWTTNQWANFQVRITAGTGLGQIRVIASNTGTTLTVASNWTVTPDATSQYVIEGDEDKIYMVGNASTAFYRYSISGNAWTVLAPTQALTTIRGSGCSLLFISKSGDSTWTTESVNKDGRYLYSHAGGSSSNISRYDIAANTWVVSIPFTPNNQTYTTGACQVAVGRYIYVLKDGTGRIDRFDIVTQSMEPYSQLNLFYGVSAGNRMCYKALDSAKSAEWIYVNPLTTYMFRQLLY